MRLTIAIWAVTIMIWVALGCSAFYTPKSPSSVNVKVEQNSNVDTHCHCKCCSDDDEHSAEEVRM